MSYCSRNDQRMPDFILPSSVWADTILGSTSANVPGIVFWGRAVLETRTSASCPAEITYFLATNTATVCPSLVCVVTEQFFDLRDRLMWVAGMLTLLTWNERRSAAQSIFCTKRFHDAIGNQRFRDARYFRCGVNGELMLYSVSFKNAGYADACGWESSRARGNIEYSRLIMPKEPRKMLSYFVY